jgi:hypothetical protein
MPVLAELHTCWNYISASYQELQQTFEFVGTSSAISYIALELCILVEGGSGKKYSHRLLDTTRTP